MNWISKNDNRQPYSWDDDTTIVDKENHTPVYIEMWFKSPNGGTVFKSTIEEVTKNKTPWGWWQPCSKLHTNGNMVNRSSGVQMKIQKKTW